MSRYDFKARVRRMFESKVFRLALGCLGIRPLSTVLTENRNLTDDAEIEKAIKFGEWRVIYSVQDTKY